MLSTLMCHKESASVRIFQAQPAAFLSGCHAPNFQMHLDRARRMIIHVTLPNVLSAADAGACGEVTQP